MKEIYAENVIIARYIQENDWQNGLSFFSKDDEFLQVGTWIYSSGRQLAAHVHNHAQRTIHHTQEVLIIKRGRLLATLYGLHNEPIEKIELRDGDILILMNGGHGYEILDNDTLVIEIKNGPYLGAEIDRRRI